MRRFKLISLILCVTVFAPSLVSCSLQNLDPYTYSDAQAIKRTIKSGYLHPAVIYPEPNDFQIMTLIEEGRMESLNGKNHRALEKFQQALIQIEQAEGKDSEMLLPIIDELVPLYMEIDQLKEADRLQHRYRKIVTAHYKEDQAVVRSADFRMGCWHGVIGDWYEAMFDFEDVVTSFDKDSEIQTHREAQLKQTAEDLADLAARNCTPHW